MRVAVIDCGTNTVRLLVAESGPTGLTDVARRLEFGRLGEGVDATGRFAAAALDRTFAILDDYARVIAATRAERVRLVATSAARDASNRDEFAAGVRARLGIGPDVITGDEEARLSFLGALSGGAVARGPVLVVDIGGGSTELIRGTVAGDVESAISLNMGSVRIRERFLTTDPPRTEAIRAARAFVRGLLGQAGAETAAVGTWIGVAGTATSLSAMYQGLATYDRTKVHDSTLTGAAIRTLTRTLLGLTVAETIARYPSLQPQRAEVIAAGALILDEIAARVGTTMVIRETDILDGAALQLMRS